MRTDCRMWRGSRVLALTGLTALGLVSIVGSGGGVAFLPSDCPPGYDCSAPPPQPSANVQPPYITAQVGTPVTFAAETANLGGTLTYQWSRSSDRGSTYVDIAGAVGRTYSLAGVNLADDRATFRVTVHSNNTVAQAVSRLAVSARPGLVFEDGEFLATDWLITPFGDANSPVPLQTVERLANGGNPGAYRRMVFTLPNQALSARVFYTSLVAGYDPQVQGAIYVIDYAEDGIALQDNAVTSTESAMLLEQGGRRYIANIRDPFDYLRTQWGATASHSSLLASDFNLFTGPACQAGESCPDFSSSGLPMRFGYWRISFGVGGNSIAHGIDNWKVTVWRR